MMNGRSSSAKSSPASRWASNSNRSPRSRRKGPASPPASCLSAASSSAEPVASITPSTASAWVRSMRPARNARSVNSPGSAGRAPPRAGSPHDGFQERRRTEGVDLGHRLARVASLAGPEIEFTRQRRGKAGEPKPAGHGRRSGERGKMHERVRPEAAFQAASQVRAADAHDPPRPSAGRRGDGDDRFVEGVHGPDPASTPSAP